MDESERPVGLPDEIHPLAPVGVSRSYGSMLLVGSKAISAVLGLVSVPIMLHVLGVESYGAIVFALVIQGILGQFDIGTSEVVLRHISAAILAHDEAEISRLNRDQYAINLLTAGLMIVMSVACGLLIPLERGGIAHVESFSIFLMMGVTSAAFRFNQVLQTLLSAYQQFQIISMGAASQAIITNAIAIAGVLIVRRPWAYVLGSLVGELSLLIFLSFRVRTVRGWTPLRFHWDWVRLKPILKQCAVNYPNRIATFFAGWGDKFMLGTATLVDLASFRNASRPADALSEMLQPLATTSLPGLSRDFHKSFQRFAENTLFSGRVVFFASALLILVPSGLAEPLLRVWLGANAPPVGETIYVQMAVYQSLQMYVAIMGIALFAAAKRAYFIPLTVLNAAVSLALTLPVYNAFGIVAIGWVKVIVSVVQVMGLWWVLGKIGFEIPALLRHMRQLSAILGMCLLFVAAGMAVSRTVPLQQAPALSLIAGPVWVVAAAWIILKLRLAALPDRIERRLRQLRRKPEPEA